MPWRFPLIIAIAPNQKSTNSDRTSIYPTQRDRQLPFQKSFAQISQR
jgi:hypothetical protein